MNYILPELGVFPMHCSANMGENGETALFFGLSGTGKTTLSADPKRQLIGDDEHGWGLAGIFNFEGGCYPKVINLDPDKEPLIWKAVHQPYALHENVVMDQAGEFEFKSADKTENTRAAYPLHYIENALASDVYPHPKYIIFLTADASGVIPAVARLEANSALYHFLSGYTSKIPGTEKGITNPKPAFSYCYGHPFMPRPATLYAELLRSYMTKYGSKVYLVNTGWQGGPYGKGGERISIKDTRRIITSILNGQLDNIPTRLDPFFNLAVPVNIEGINPGVLKPRDLWPNKRAYDNQARQLVAAFVENIKRFPAVPEEIVAAGPK